MVVAFFVEENGNIRQRRFMDTDQYEQFFCYYYLVLHSSFRNSTTYFIISVKAI